MELPEETENGAVFFTENKQQGGQDGMGQQGCGCPPPKKTTCKASLHSIRAAL